LQQQSSEQNGQSHVVQEEEHSVFDFAATLVATTAPADNTIAAMTKITFFMIVIFKVK
jgi:hypothetical protein